VCISISCRPKASLLLREPLRQTLLLGLTSEAAGSLLAVRGSSEHAASDSEPCSQVPEGVPAPQLKTSTGNPPPPGAQPVPPSYKPIGWAPGREETQEVCTFPDVCRCPTLLWNKQPPSLAAPV